MYRAEAPPVVIRGFDKSKDYPARVAIHNATYSDQPVSEAELRSWDSKDHPDPKYLNERLVVELQGDQTNEVDQTNQGEAAAVVAYLWYGHRPGLYHPRKLHFNLAVHPDYRHRGIGSLLFERMLAGIAGHDPIQIMTGTFDNQTEALEFLDHRGFTEQMRAWVSYLEVDEFDPAPFEGALDRVTVEGFQIRSEAELADDPEFELKLYDLFTEVLQDVPAPDPITPQTFERFKETRKNDLNRIPEAFLVAIEPSSGTYVGTTSLWKLQSADFLNTGLTGVRRAYRRKGLALGLKLAAIEWAKRVGAKRLRTDNESGNRAMLSINEMLGFKRGAAEIALAKILQEDPDTSSAGAHSGRTDPPT